MSTRDEVALGMSRAVITEVITIQPKSRSPLGPPHPVKPRTRWLCAILIACLLAAGGTFGPKRAEADSTIVSGLITGGDITHTIVPVILKALPLDGSGLTEFTGTTTPWVFRDARGTGMPWALTVAGTPFSHWSDAAQSPNEIRDVDVAHDPLRIDSVRVISETGSDPAPSGESVLLSTRQQTLIAARSTAKGSFSVSPMFSVRLPTSSPTQLSKVPAVCVITYTFG